MASTTTGMLQRLAKLRGGCPTATQKAGSDGGSTTSSSAESLLQALDHHPVRAFSLIEGLHCCLTSFGLRQFDGLIPDPEFRISPEGEVWNPVTPELLGWMLARIEIGLRSPTAGTSADLSQAIALFHGARDLSGLEPGRLPSAAWVPPGYGRKFPDLSDPVTGIYSRYQVWRIEGLQSWCGKNAHSEQATA